MSKITFETPVGLIEGSAQSNGSVILDYPSSNLIQKLHPDSESFHPLIFLNADFPGWVEIPCDDSFYPPSYYKIVESK